MPSPAHDDRSRSTERVASPDRSDEPVAKRVAHTWQRPTGPVDDPWAWLLDRDDPDTVGYLTAENDHTELWFSDHRPMIDELFDEIRSRVQETDDAVPVRKGPWWYSARTVEGLAYPIHTRGSSAAGATDVVLLDENVEADGHDFFDLGVFDVSPDHRIAAWSVDTDGGERYTVRFRDLDGGVDLDDVLEGTNGWGGSAWSTDATTWFYLVPDDQMRPHQVWRHVVGTPQSDDVMVFDEPDERCFVGVGLTRSERLVVIESSSKTSSQAWLLDASDPTGPLHLVRARAEGVEYGVDDWGDRLVVLTNLDADDFRVMTAPEHAPDQWTEFVAHVPGRRITAIEPFASHLAVHEWADAQPRITIVDRDGRAAPLDLGELAAQPHDVEFDANPEWETSTIRIAYRSLTVPNSVYDVDVTTGERTLLKRQPTPNTDLGAYVSERMWATASDGTRVPIDVVRHRDTEPDGSNPCVVYGYGSYEASMPPWFSVARLSLLERGWVWALVHPRGGGELGRRWWNEGKLLTKRNTFTDTLACVEHLGATGWAHPGRVVLRGGSAGGLLVGACITMRPELFAAAVAEVPFVDVVSTMSDPSLPLTVTEWDEWGDPRTEPFASYMASYSPYDNTTAREYPALYVTAGLNDPRVSYHEPAKWVAKLRAVRTNRLALLLKTEMGAGHGGPSGRYDQWRDEATTLAFILAVTP